MSDPREQTASAPGEPQVLADSGLRCPHCQYNLTGVAVDRCPECGERFDRRQLIAILEGAPSPIPIWDDEGVFIVVRFVHMCLLTWFAPSRVGRTFPRRYRRRSARRFRRAVVLIAALVLMVTLRLVSWPVPALNLYHLRAVIGLVAGVPICESMLAGVLAAFLSPGGWPDSMLASPEASESWTGLVGMFRSFILLEALVAVTGLAAGRGRVAFDIAPLVCLCVIPIWWYLGVAAAAWVQQGHFLAKVCIVLMIPVLVGIAAIVAVFTGFFAVALLEFAVDVCASFF